jgi:hypothetical protein
MSVLSAFLSLLLIIITCAAFQLKAAALHTPMDEGAQIVLQGAGASDIQFSIDHRPSRNEVSLKRRS